MCIVNTVSLANLTAVPVTKTDNVTCLLFLLERYVVSWLTEWTTIDVGIQHITVIINELVVWSLKKHVFSCIERIFYPSPQRESFVTQKASIRFDTP